MQIMPKNIIFVTMNTGFVCSFISKNVILNLFKGEWKPRQIDNPAFKGKWVHPEIDNPEYTADNEIYKYDSIGVIGLDLWQVAICFVSQTQLQFSDI